MANVWPCKKKKKKIGSFCVSTLDGYETGFVLAGLIQVNDYGKNAW